MAATDFRTAVAYAKLGAWQDAYAALRGAQSIQERLSKENISLKWDLADTDMKLGEVIAAMFGPRDATDAYSAYKTGVGLREDLRANDPGSLRYRKQLAADYDKLIGFIETMNLGDDDDARKARWGQYQNVAELAAKDNENAQWLGLAKLGRLAKRRGDMAKKPEFKLKSYRDALDAWRQLSAAPKGATLFGQLYDDHIQIGDALVQAAPPDWRDATVAYNAAAKIARLNLANDPSNPVWSAHAEDAALRAFRALDSERASPPQ